jgi:16S rRNA (uracil1498-N3)-methyltransferase
LREGRIELPLEEAHQAVVSRRTRPGDEIILFDGQGHEAEATVMLTGRRTVVAEARRIVRRDFELIHRITLAVAASKGHRQAYLVEKCTELGVAALWPMIAGRSVTRADKEACKKWSRRAIEAAKQSGRAWVPVVDPPRMLPEVVERAGEFGRAVFGDERPGGSPWNCLLAELPVGSSILVCIGPEGGWTNEERTLFATAGFSAISLAPTILRTETAAVAVCAAAAVLGVSG